MGHPTMQTGAVFARSFGNPYFYLAFFQLDERFLL
jgi:hypothetical protein